ncbi:hypothetical protein THAR02_02574 [Trichoderma harzianum]|uniref:Uncharacterized protein n=1 Tax=Trichoderma harzianum TaxID=5544 RepID=A0A0F9XZ92_TRIHA|nr:hypothetical protein THAR02_02574 [Trichoderma harzianum]
MASYHRVLRTFGRTIDDNTLECDYDIHPWDILVDNQRWPGKIRLVGYIDVFFLMCYSGESRFEHGIIIYKDDEIIRQLLKRAGLRPEDKPIQLECINDKEEKDGHPINLSTRYPKSKLKKYTIVLHKGHTPAMQKEILRGVMQHGVARLLTDALKLGVVSTAELVSKVKETILSGSSLDAVTTRSINALTSTNPHNISLSGDKL